VSVYGGHIITESRNAMTVLTNIEIKLTEAFAPVHLSVIDESHKHAGHSGAPEGGESHFRVEIVSPFFDGLTRLARQRAIYAVLKEELATKVHALALKAKTPAENEG